MDSAKTGAGLVDEVLADGFDSAITKRSSVATVRPCDQSD